MQFNCSKTGRTVFHSYSKRTQIKHFLQYFTNVYIFSHSNCWVLSLQSAAHDIYSHICFLGTKTKILKSPPGTVYFL